jgi:hypothetical protein
MVGAAVVRRDYRTVSTVVTELGFGVEDSRSPSGEPALVRLVLCDLGLVIVQSVPYVVVLANGTESCAPFVRLEPFVPGPPRTGPSETLRRRAHQDESNAELVEGGMISSSG